MAFHCYKCGKTIDERKELINHLRKDHMLKDNAEAMNCAVVGCSRTFLTFNGLSAHLKSYNHQTFENVCCNMLFYNFFNRRNFVSIYKKY